jgi:hypothetical protein
MIRVMRRLDSARPPQFGCAVRVNTRRGRRAISASRHHRAVVRGHLFNNCYKNGLLPVVLPDAAVDRLFADTFAFPGFQLTLDLERQIVSTPDGTQVYGFDVEPFRKHCLLNGLDEIGLTLQHAEAIRAFETKRLTEYPWLA